MSRTTRSFSLATLFALALISVSFATFSNSAQAERIRPSGPVLPLPPTEIL